MKRTFCYNDQKHMKRYFAIQRLLWTLPATLLAAPERMLAAVFDGGGINAGINAAKGISGLTQKPLRELVIDITIRLLNFLSLAAVVTIIIAGVWLIFGLGEETSKEKAKNIITYTLIGLVIVFLARLLVKFVLVIIS